MAKMLSQKDIKKDEKEVLAEAIIAAEERIGRLRFPSAFRNQLAKVIKHKKILFSGGLLIASTTLSNVLNFAFSIYLGRVLSFNNFALISLMNSLYAFASLFVGPLSLTVNYRSGFLMGKYDDASGYLFWGHVRKYSLYYGLGICLLWLFCSPFLNIFFQTASLLFFLSFAIIILSGFASGVDKGFLTARLFFGQLALIVLLEPVARILLTIVLLWIKQSQFIYLTIPLSFLIAFLFGWILIISQKPKSKNNSTKNEVFVFPSKFLFISFISGLSTLSFVSLDIVLAKHYLLPNDAGRYALVSLIGKTVYFLGGLASPFVVPLVSRDLGSNKNTTGTLYRLLLFTFILSFLGFLCFGVFSPFSVPLLLGSKAYNIIPYLNLFLFAMMCFSVSQIFISFYQIQKIYSFSIAGFILSILQIVLIILNHTSTFSIVLAMSFVGIANLFVMTLMHFQWRKVRLFENNLMAFLKNYEK